MKKKQSRFVHFLVFIFCAVAGAAALYYMISVHTVHLSYSAENLEESTSSLDNPYCGFYQMNGYTLSEENTAQLAAEWGTQRCESDPYPLMLLEINLRNYSNQSLSQNALDQLDEILTACGTAKKQIILRFLYDWDGKATETEPNTLQQIKNHMSQVSGIVNKHVDCVYIMQGVFTGNNGEMHGTKYGDPDQVRQLMEQLSNTVNPAIYLSVRTPAQLRSILRNKVPSAGLSLYQNTLTSRLGLFNDGMLGSVYDLGTYDDTPMENASDYNEKGTREEELRFQDTLCQYVPNGGEVTIDNEYNDLDHAVDDLSVMHVSYLNADHDLAVLNKWKQSTWRENDIFFGCSGYDYIARHLGYRYVLTASSIQFRTYADDFATLYLHIANTGFAPAYRQFTTELTAVNEETGDTYEIENTIDNRKITSGDESIFKIQLDVHSWEKGTYKLQFSMKDSALDQPVYFANTGYETQDSIVIGTLTLH